MKADGTGNEKRKMLRDAGRDGQGPKLISVGLGPGGSWIGGQRPIPEGPSPTQRAQIKAPVMLSMEGLGATKPRQPGQRPDPTVCRATGAVRPACAWFWPQCSPEGARTHRAPRHRARDVLHCVAWRATEVTRADGTSNRWDGAVCARTHRCQVATALRSSSRRQASRVPAKTNEPDH
jgi:hypothetical protein